MVRSPELLFAALFTFFAASVLIAGAVELLLLLRRRGKVRPPESRGRLWTRRLLLSAAGAGLLCIGWGFFVEPFRPEVTRHRVESPALRPGTGPLRVVQISDLHCDPEPRIEEELAGLLAAEKPDIVVFTGDAANSPEGLPFFRRTLADVAKVAPTFAVKGNWDAWFFPDLDRFGGTGAVELDGEARILEVRGMKVAVAGVGWDSPDSFGPALAGLPRDAVTLLLCHSPDQAVHADRLLGEMPDAPRLDLVLAGHTHGGQVALPLVGPVVTLTRAGPPLARGMHRLDRTLLYTNRGIGMEGGSVPRVRFLARPEIAVFDFVPPGEGEGK